MNCYRTLATVRGSTRPAGLAISRGVSRGPWLGGLMPIRDRTAIEHGVSYCFRQIILTKVVIFFVHT